MQLWSRTGRIGCADIGNLVFRLLHNVVFACVHPRNRVHVAMLAMAASMAILAFVVFLAREHQLFWVFLACARALVDLCLRVCVGRDTKMIATCPCVRAS